MSQKRLRVGIISANWGVKCHLPAWRAVDGVDVVAICTSRAETAKAAAAAHDIPKAYWDYKAMAADPDIDLIDIGTRPSLRYAMAKAAIAQGKHIYMGVPLAASRAQAEELVAMAKAANIIGATDAYLEYIPAHQQMRQMIADGFLGEVYGISIDMQVNLFNPPTDFFSYFWFGDPENGASALRNLGTHAFTLLTALFGEVEEAIGRPKRFVHQWRSAQGDIYHPQVPDTVTALLQMRSGALATVNISWVASGGIGWRVEAYGAKGRLTATHADRFPNTSATHLYAATPAQGAAAPVSSWSDVRHVPLSRAFTHAPHVGIDHDFSPAPSYPMALAFHQLRQAIMTGGAAEPSLARGLHVERIIDAIMRSDHSQRWEAVD